MSMLSSSTLWITSTPRLLWDAYVEYLWNYQPGSWVASIASFFRVLAIILVLPVVLLTLLDVTSYVIARTLGIVDDVKASTSDIVLPDLPPTEASVCINNQSRARTRTCEEGETRGMGMGESEDLAPEEEEISGRLNLSQFQSPSLSQQMASTNEPPAPTHHLSATQQPNSVSQSRSRSELQSQSQSLSQSQVGAHEGNLHASDRVLEAEPRSLAFQTYLSPPEMYYFAGEDDVPLSAVGDFSMPPSPLIPRTTLHSHTRTSSDHVDSTSGEEGVPVHSVEMNEVMHDDDGIILRRRVGHGRDQGVKEEEEGRK